jgi:hypothetical protein
MEEQGYSPLFYIGLAMLLIGLLGMALVGGAAGGM